MKESKIQWTDSTVNFWMGCKKVSQGCKYCYMHRMMDKDGKNGSNVWRVSDQTFYRALRWTEPKLIFTCSMSDFFLEEADAWRKDAWRVIKRTPQHQWQILTKRPERILECLPDDWNDGYNNVWLGVSVENQDFLYRAKMLSEIPAKIRFISAEPLLGEIDIHQWADNEVLNLIDWVIIGGESGFDTGKYRYRECRIEWIEKLIEDLKGYETKVFVKQVGTFLSKQQRLRDWHGGNINEWPENIQVREYPQTNSLDNNEAEVSRKLELI